MAEIDLIPDDYRQYLHLKWTVRLYLIFFLTMVFCIVAGRIGATHFIEAEKTAIEKLEAHENVILEQNKKFESLSAQRDFLKTRIEALKHLQGGPPAQQMFIAISRAINASTWITHWKFLRAGEFQEKKTTFKKSGYYVVQPKDPKKLWRQQTHMEIKGQTLKHSSLADFVKKLLEEPVIDGIHELKTWTQNNENNGVIEYSLAVTIASNRNGQ